MIIPRKTKTYKYTKLDITPFYILIANLFFVISSVIGTCIFELFLTPQNIVSHSCTTIINHSFKAFIYQYIFLLFWAFAGYGLRLTFLNKIFASIFIAVIQLVETYVIFHFKPEILKYFPTSLSRQLILNNFNFWNPESWVNAKSAITYITAPMIVDKSYIPITVSYFYIIVLLIWYLVLAYLVPTIRHFIQNSK